MMDTHSLFSIKGLVAIVTGGAGVLGGSIAGHLLSRGAKVAILDIRQERLDEKVEALRASGEVAGLVCNVLDMDSLRDVRRQIVERWQRIDILVNVAGGNISGATLRPEQSVFEMNIDDYNRVTQLNLNGTVYPSLVFGETMARNGKGSIVNISSMATYGGMTRVPGYSIAKTGVNIFTQWMAMELAQKYGDNVRVNAIAPGFFIGDQNRAVLVNPDGALTERSQKVLAKTPMNRFGDISELNGAVQFLCSPAASFITGAILPVDGGFSSYTGV